MPLHVGFFLDHVFQAMLSILELSWGWFSQFSQEVGVRFGLWGTVGLYLLATMMSMWLVYQLFRILAFILMRIVLPLALVALSLFLLIVLTS